MRSQVVVVAGALGAWLAVCLSLSCAPQGALALQSRFNRPINEKRLEEDWADEEDEEWHEDSYEWKQKMRAKHRPAFDPGNPDSFLQHAMSGDGLQMMFASLKKDVIKTKRQTEEVGARWQTLMKTAGVVTTVYATDVGQLLLSDADGHALQVKEFVLQQPETESFRWKEKDFYPAGAAPPKKETAARLDAVKRRTGEEPKPDAEKAASGKKTKSKKGKAAKKSAEKPAEKQDL